MAKKSAPIHCALCLRVIDSKDIEAKKHTYSAWTGNRYCPQEREASCREIRAKLIKAGKVDPKGSPWRKNNKQFDFAAVNQHKEKKKAQRIKRKGGS